MRVYQFRHLGLKEYANTFYVPAFFSFKEGASIAENLFKRKSTFDQTIQKK